MQFNLFHTQHIKEKQVCEQTTTAHILVYILHGNILTKQEEKEQTYNSGQWIFIPQGNTLILQPKKNKNFTAFILTFTPGILPVKETCPITRLTKTPDTESLYYSLLPYYYYEKEPTPEIMNLKLQAACYCLLQNKKEIFNCLFDIN